MFNINSKQDFLLADIYTADDALFQGTARGQTFLKNESLFFKSEAEIKNAFFDLINLSPIKDKFGWNPKLIALLKVEGRKYCISSEKVENGAGSVETIDEYKKNGSDYDVEFFDFVDTDYNRGIWAREWLVVVPKTFILEPVSLDRTCHVNQTVTQLKMAPIFSTVILYSNQDNYQEEIERVLIENNLTIKVEPLHTVMSNDYVPGVREFLVTKLSL